MTGLNIQISSNAADIAQKFRNLAKKTADRNTPNKAIAVQLFGDMARNFETQGGQFADAWAPLAPSTAKYKARHGWSPQPMLRTGFLRNTMWSNATQDYTVVGFTADYASYHDDTDDKYVPGKFLPRRRLLPPIPYAYQRGVDVYNWYIKKSIAEEGL